MNQPSRETAKLLLQLIKPIAKKRMIKDQKEGEENEQMAKKCR